MRDQLAAMFEQAGLPHAEQIDRIPNSRHALILGELARERGVLDDLHGRLFEAYWGRGLDIGSDEVLHREGESVGLTPEAIDRALGDPAYLQQITQQTQQAVSLGARGVPAWVIDERVLIPGAQPHEVFEQVMEQLGHPPLGTGESGS